MRTCGAIGSNVLLHPMLELAITSSSTGTSSLSSIYQYYSRANGLHKKLNRSAQKTGAAGRSRSVALSETIMFT